MLVGFILSRGPYKIPAATDAMLSPDFPRTADLRVYHLGLKAGEVANRIVRARCLRSVCPS